MDASNPETVYSAGSGVWTQARLITVSCWARTVPMSHRDKAEKLGTHVVSVNNLPKVATQWNSGAIRDSNPGPRARIPSALTTGRLSDCVVSLQRRAACSQGGGGARSRFYLHQQLQRLPVWAAVRRLQAVGHWTRERPPNARLLHAAQVRLRWDDRRHLLSTIGLMCS